MKYIFLAVMFLGAGAELSGGGDGEFHQLTIIIGIISAVIIILSNWGTI